MNRRLATGSIHLALGLLIAAHGWASALELGDKAPGFAVAKWLAGEKVDPTIIDGNAVYMVEIWATTCQVCLAAIPMLNDLHNRYNSKGLKIVGFSMQNESETEAHLRRHPITYSCFADTPGSDTYFKYVASGQRISTPLVFIFDRRGILAWTGNPTDNIEPIITKILSGRYDIDAFKRIKTARDGLNQATASKNIKAIIAACQNLLAVEPENPRGHEIRTKLIGSKHIPGDLGKSLREWARTCPNDPTGLNKLAATAIQSDDPDAIQFGIKAGERAARLSTTKDVRASLYLAQGYINTGQQQKAVALLNEIEPLADDQERTVVRGFLEFISQ